MTEYPGKDVMGRPCTCPHGIRSLGMLEGINMGKGMVRLHTTKGCPTHDTCQHYIKGDGKWCPIHGVKGCDS